MSATLDECYATWRRFLQRWPLETLDQMTLPQYAQAGNKDSFVNWLETGTESLGSMWGGSSFKFGVYSRKDQKHKLDGKGLRYTTDYAWLGKYGDTAEDAFQNVLAIIVQVARAARAGDMATVEKATLGTVTKWKLAFLYQNTEAPCVLPIYSKESLQAISATDVGKSCQAMQERLMSEWGGHDILEYGDRLWKRIEEINAAKLGAADAYSFLSSSDQYEEIRDATQNMSWFRSVPEGLEIALARDNKVPTLYLSQGSWLDEKLRGQLASVKLYKADKSRTGSVGDGARSLGLGNPIVKTTVSTRAALIALCDAYAGGEDSPEISISTDAMEAFVNDIEVPLNQILYGPPGTGKTFATVDAALSILDPEFLEQHGADRTALKSRFDALAKEQRVRFVTFHQSFSYEDFVEGIRANVSPEEGETATAVSYAVRPGVFVELCQDAKRDKVLDERLGVREGANVWKLSIEEASSAGDTRRYCLEHGEARIGWPDAGDIRTADWKALESTLGSNERHSLRDFGLNIVPGDVMVCLASKTSIGAVGVVTGEYEYTPEVPEGVRPDYVHRLPVNWLAKRLNFDMRELNQGKQLTLKTVYQLRRIQWPDLLAGLKIVRADFSSAKLPAASLAEPYVLIIDEINRGNVSRIFGELITLIEPSKRAGADEALKVVLPYSQESFSVPSNVYLIGTMNTADRSLASLDVALRRRFVFTSMPPQPELLDDTVVDGIVVGQLLRIMNQRIEALLDRDHCLGHAYFMPLRDDPSLARLGSIFRNQVLPLLQEYFFDDWQRIQWVLNDHRKPRELQFVQFTGVNVAELFGAEVNVARSPQIWAVNANAFTQVGSYLGIVDHAKATGVQ